MSFSSNVKEELSSVEIFSPCCLQAQCYGLVLFGRGFSAADISISTENSAVGRLYAENIKAFTGVQARVGDTSGRKITVSVEKKEERLQIFNQFGHSEKDVALRLNRANILNDCCFSAFLRGAFLSCGTVATPEKSYHMEFSVPYLKLSRDLFSLMEELELSPKYTTRKNNHLIYFKDSESIEDVLTVMGATASSLELMAIKMNKDMRNKINRRVNFETANISRAVNAAMIQVAAIKKIEKTRGISSLPENLRELAEVRRDNPDATLAELCELLSQPISRSGINHRLSKIIQIADEI